MIYLIKQPSNIGPFQVRVDPDSDEATAYYTDITETPQPFTPGIAAGLLSQYPKHIAAVEIEDVAAGLLHESERYACKVEDCDKDYSTQNNLDRHSKDIHGNLLQQLAGKINN